MSSRKPTKDQRELLEYLATGPKLWTQAGSFAEKVVASCVRRGWVNMCEVRLAREPGMGYRITDSGKGAIGGVK